MNPFQLSYFERLQSWSTLRQNVAHISILDKCVAVDAWWQRAPLVNHYLHPAEIHSWPNPWELLHENEYCTVARAAGICYTLLLLDVEDVELCTAVDEWSEECNLVLVDGAKYVLNYYPNTVVNTTLQQFTIRQKYNITPLHSKIR